MKRPPLERLDLPLYDAMLDAIEVMAEEAAAGFPSLPDDPTEALAILAMIARNLEPEQRCQDMRIRAITRGGKLAKQMLRGECTADEFARATAMRVPDTAA